MLFGRELIETANQSTLRWSLPATPIPDPACGIQLECLMPLGLFLPCNGGTVIVERFVLYKKTFGYRMFIIPHRASQRLIGAGVQVQSGITQL